MLALLLLLQDPYTVRPERPRLLVDDPKGLAARVKGSDDYKVVKERADRALRGGVEFLGNKWAIPEDLMNLGLAWLVERDRRYAEAVVKAWGDGAILRAKECHFGYHAIAYDWVFDALSPEQRTLYGDALGGWLRWYTDRPEILLKSGDWLYNQTWGPVHLNVMHSRDALTQKLFIALAILGAGTSKEADAKSFLDSWHKRVAAECVPDFDRMGGVWSESMGHGGYGPVSVIPYAFQAWRTSTGIDLFKRGKPWGFPAEAPRWTAFTMMPHNDRAAWIDDSDGGRPGAFVRSAPMLRDGLSRHLGDKGKEWIRERWQRVACLDPSIAPKGPETLPLGYLFPGAGHVYARSAWNDPNATWAFFGAGPQFAGHARDDEGHFMISRKGALVSRAGGSGGNDDDYYVGGSLVYNLPTIFDPAEKFRRDRANENDGGLLRHVYETGPWPRERGRVVAFEHAPGFTYAAADLTKGYNAGKAKEVSRQFLYLRGKKEFFVVFDRVEATKPEFARHWFLHVPTEPAGNSWLSLPEADGDKEVLSSGRSRAFLHTLLPAGAPRVVRGGPGQDAWGHPLEKTAQYNHDSPGRRRPPICPWRVEVADPGPGARTLFLHVIEVADEAATATPVTFVAPAGLDVDGRRVRFNPDGPLGGTLDGVPLSTSLKTDAQYR
ncbi:MAG TPA: hypothetical protein VF950_03020 [Planctomycetota bacterium]